MKLLKFVWSWLVKVWTLLFSSQASRLGWLLIPAFAGAVWFGINMVFPDPDDAADIKANLLNAGTFSVRVFAALFFVHLVTHPKVWAWDLPNTRRVKLQETVVEGRPGQQIGAFTVLAGETFAKLWLLGQLLRALVLWPQGVA